MVKVTTTKLIVFCLHLSFGGHKSFLWGHWYSCFGLLVKSALAPGFQSQGGCPCLCASLPLCNGILRFTSGAIPTDLLAANLAAEPFLKKLILTCTQISADIKSENEKFPGNVTHIIIISSFNKRETLITCNLTFLISFNRIIRLIRSTRRERE